MGFPLKISKKSSQNKKPRLKPGTYISEIIAVEDVDGYKPGDAFRVRYALVDESTSRNFTKSEVFITGGNPRFTKFIEYLEANNLSVMFTDDLLGICERLTLGYEFINDNRFLNVVEREFISNDLKS